MINRLDPLLAVPFGSVIPVGIATEETSHDPHP
jgi:hypothetical protein